MPHWNDSAKKGMGLGAYSGATTCWSAAGADCDKRTHGNPGVGSSRRDSGSAMARKSRDSIDSGGWKCQRACQLHDSGHGDWIRCKLNEYFLRSSKSIYLLLQCDASLIEAWNVRIKSCNLYVQLQWKWRPEDRVEWLEEMWREVAVYEECDGRGSELAICMLGGLVALHCGRWGTGHPRDHWEPCMQKVESGVLTCLSCTPLRATSHTRLKAHVHCNLRALIGRKGGARPSSLHTWRWRPKGPNKTWWMQSLHGVLQGGLWIRFHGLPEFTSGLPPRGGPDANSGRPWIF